MEKRYQVFISSTFLDLKEEREKVMQAVLKQKCFPAGMELFPATNNNMMDYIKQVIDDSDYYVLIIGARYGSIDNEGISYTEKEFNYAVDREIPVLAFLHGAIGSLPREKYDDEITTLLPKLDKFREKVEHTGRLVQYWTNADELARDVSDSLREAIKLSPRPGWVRTKSPKIRETILEKKDSKETQNEHQGLVKPFKVGNVTFNMVYVKGGTFMMGANEDDPLADDEEKPAHKVTLSDYWIGETQVTQEVWEAVMEENPHPSRLGEDSKCPVESVSWIECQKFIERLNDMLREQTKGIGEFRLPTEAQWEYAARGGILGSHKNAEFSGRNYDLDKVAWYTNNSGGKPHPVAELDANELGLYDMSGNVWEWCEDWYGPYSSDPQIDPKGAKKGSYRVRRGSGWGGNEDYCRVSYRRKDKPTVARNYTGLRLALVPIHK